MAKNNKYNSDGTLKMSIIYRLKIKVTPKSLEVPEVFEVPTELYFSNKETAEKLQWVLKDMIDKKGTANVEFENTFHEVYDDRSIYEVLKASFKK